MKNIRDILKEVSIFHGLSENNLQALEEKMILTVYKKGDFIFREGELGQELYILVEGHVSVLKKDREGHEHEIIELKGGTLFGEMSLIDIQKRAASIRVLSETTIAILNYSSLLDVYHDNLELFTKIVLNIAREISRRLRRMDKLYVEFSDIDPEKLPEFRQKFEP